MLSNILQGECTLPLHFLMFQFCFIKGIKNDLLLEYTFYSKQNLEQLSYF